MDQQIKRDTKNQKKQGVEKLNTKWKKAQFSGEKISPNNDSLMFQT